MIKIKNFLLIIISLGFIVGAFYLKDILLEKLVEFFRAEPKVIIEPGNDYTKDDIFSFVTSEDDYIPHNYDDLKNIYYSVLNQGWLQFTFYCPQDYTTCLADLANISNDKSLLSDINNYVHPYNSYQTIRTIYDETGEVTIFVGKLYSTTEVMDLNEKIDSIINRLITDDMDTYTKIKTLHDYIIAETKYDTECANKCTSKDENCKCPKDSKRMTGALYNHYAICSGYTDLMAVMLEKLGIKNYKIASDTHIWNAVYYNNEWLHLDLTWDDPLTSTGEESYSDDFFLKTNKELYEADSKTTDHYFDKLRYPEFDN